MSAPLPPGQFLLGQFPRFGLGKFARRFPAQPERIAFEIGGDVAQAVAVERDFSELPRTGMTADFHCVTTWSVRDRGWSGVLFSDFYERLVVPRAARAECAVLKAVAAHFVMHAAERVALYARQRDVIAGLVAAYERDPHRLDPDLRGDWEAAGDDGAALRVLVDQVASLTDVRALTLHRRWCRDTP